MYLQNIFTKQEAKEDAAVQMGYIYLSLSDLLWKILTRVTGEQCQKRKMLKPNSSQVRVGLQRARGMAVTEGRVQVMGEGRCHCS